MTTRVKGMLAVGAVIALCVAALGSFSASAGAKTRDAVARMYDAEDNFVGSVRFIAKPGGVTSVKVSVSGLTAGWHGIHIHSVGECDPDAVDPSTGSTVPFFSAGTHWNPDGQIHGNHKGDLPPLFVMADGIASAKNSVDRFTKKELYDEDGSAVIIHASPDNLAHVPAMTTAGAERYHSHSETDPAYTLGPDTATKGTGDAGARFACGLVEKETEG
ncbi:MAG: superoxide dismutase family protein [Actinomycetota bacterium]